MKLPNGANAFVDIEKLRGYCLNAEHRRGQHKARVFQSSCGVTSADAEELSRQLLLAASAFDVQEAQLDEYGQRYLRDLEVVGPEDTAMVRSAWIIRHDEDFPRFVSCYVM